MTVDNMRSRLFFPPLTAVIEKNRSFSFLSLFFLPTSVDATLTQWTTFFFSWGFLFLSY